MAVKARRHADTLKRAAEELAGVDAGQNTRDAAGDRMRGEHQGQALCDALRKAWAACRACSVGGETSAKGGRGGGAPQP